MFGNSHMSALLYCNSHMSAHIQGNAHDPDVQLTSQQSQHLPASSEKLKNSSSRMLRDGSIIPTGGGLVIFAFRAARNL